jgi:C4-dicarboxylate transporter
LNLSKTKFRILASNRIVEKEIHFRSQADALSQFQSKPQQSDSSTPQFYHILNALLLVLKNVLATESLISLITKCNAAPAWSSVLAPQFLQIDTILHDKKKTEVKAITDQSEVKFAMLAFFFITIILISFSDPTSLDCSPTNPRSQR